MQDYLAAADARVSLGAENPLVGCTEQVSDAIGLAYLGNECSDPSITPFLCTGPGGGGGDGEGDTPAPPAEPSSSGSPVPASDTPPDAPSSEAPSPPPSFPIVVEAVPPSTPEAAPVPRSSPRPLSAAKPPAAPAPPSPLAVDACVSGTCYPGDAANGCPFTAYSAPDYAGTVEGGNGSAALNALWQELPGQQLVMG